MKVTLSGGLRCCKSRMTEQSLLKAAVFSEIYRRIDVYNANGAVDVAQVIRNIPRFRSSSIAQRKFLNVRSPVNSSYHELGKSRPVEEQVNSKVKDVVNMYESTQDVKVHDRESRSETGDSDLTDVISPTSSFDFRLAYESSDESESECSDSSVAHKMCPRANVERGIEHDKLLSTDQERSKLPASSGEERKSQTKQPLDILRSNTTAHVESDSESRATSEMMADLRGVAEAATPNEFDLRFHDAHQVRGGQVGHTTSLSQHREDRIESKQIANYSGYLNFPESSSREFNESNQIHRQLELNTKPTLISQPPDHEERGLGKVEAAPRSSWESIGTPSPQSNSSSATISVNSHLLSSDDRSHSSSTCVSIIRGKTGRARSVTKKTMQSLHGKFAGRVLTTLIQPFVQLDTQIREFCREQLQALETQKKSNKLKIQDSHSADVDSETGRHDQQLTRLYNSSERSRSPNLKEIHSSQLSVRQLNTDDSEMYDFESTKFSCGAPLIQKVSNFLGMSSNRHRRKRMAVSIGEGMDWSSSLKSYSYKPSGKPSSPRVPNQRRKAVSRGTPSKRNPRSSKSPSRRSSRSSSPRVSSRSGSSQRQGDWHSSKRKSVSQPVTVRSETEKRGHRAPVTQLRDLLRQPGTQTAPPMGTTSLLESKPAREPMCKSDSKVVNHTNCDPIDCAVPRWWLYSGRGERMRSGLAPSRFQREHLQRLASMSN